MSAELWLPYLTELTNQSRPAKPISPDTTGHGPTLATTARASSSGVSCATPGPAAMTANRPAINADRTKPHRVQWFRSRAATRLHEAAVGSVHPQSSTARVQFDSAPSPRWKRRNRTSGEGRHRAAPSGVHASSPVFNARDLGGVVPDWADLRPRTLDGGEPALSGARVSIEGDARRRRVSSPPWPCAPILGFSLEAARSAFRCRAPSRPRICCSDCRANPWPHSVGSD